MNPSRRILNRGKSPVLLSAPLSRLRSLPRYLYVLVLLLVPLPRLKPLLRYLVLLFDGLGLSFRPSRKTESCFEPVGAASAAIRPGKQPSLPTGSRVELPYSMILATTPAPTVRPPSRIANRRPSSIAIGAISSTTICTLSPGITISVPSGNSTAPVTSVVRK